MSGLTKIRRGANVVKNKKFDKHRFIYAQNEIWQEVQRLSKVIILSNDVEESANSIKT